MIQLYAKSYTRAYFTRDSYSLAAQMDDGTIAHQLECDMQVERPRPHLATVDGVDVRDTAPCEVQP